MASQGTRTGVRERVRVRVRPRRRRRRVALGLAVLGAVALVGALDAIWVARTASRELGATRARLAAGADALLAGRLEEASASFVLARTSAGHASAALGHPMAAAAGWLPIVGNDVDAVRALSHGSELAAQAGESLVRAARDAGWDGTTVPGVASGSSVNTSAISAARPDLASAASLLSDAERTLAAISGEGLFGPVEEALEVAKRQVSSRARLVETAHTLSGLLPGFLGDPIARTYLVIMQNLSDPRGSGGYVGTYALLSAANGHIDLERMAPTGTLGRVPPVDAPPDIVARYEPFGSLTNFTAATYSPDFPTSARLLMQMWDARGEPPVDGVISVDPVWMSYILEGIGSVQTPAWPEPITAQNVTDILLRQTFETLSHPVSDVTQGVLAKALWGAVLERPLPAKSFGEAMARAAAERHLQVYSADAREERQLDALGASGRVEPGENPLMVGWNGGVAARTGFFASKKVTYRATLAPDGSADVTVTVTLTNDAPSGPPSILLGAGAGHDVPVGYYGSFVNVYVARGAQQIEVHGGTLQLVQREFGLPVVLGLIGAPSGDTATLRVTYRVPELATRAGSDWTFRLNVVALPALRPDRVRVSVRLPPGAHAVSHTPDARLQGGVFGWEGAPTVSRSLWVRFRTRA